MRLSVYVGLVVRTTSNGKPDADGQQLADRSWLPGS